MNLLFIESTRFTERIQELRAEPNLWKLQSVLCQNPEADDMIQGTGGFRKIRMGLPGRGKRGGCRIIYVYIKRASRVYFVYLYPKNEEVDLDADQRNSLKQISREIYEEVKKDAPSE